MWVMAGSPALTGRQLDLVRLIPTHDIHGDEGVFAGDVDLGDEVRVLASPCLWLIVQ